MDETLLNNKDLVDELIRGRDSTRKLRNLLRREINGDDSVDDLVGKILASFSDSLSALGSCVSADVSTVASDCSDERKDDDNGKKPAPAAKDRRGCYKRRKTSDSRIKVANTIDDGYAWRKYGQKEILNAKFPRCYFRCTHKNTQGCKALKQIQKLEDDSEMFHITYFGHHTCQSAHEKGYMFSDSTALNSFLLNFENPHPSTAPSVITNTHITHLVKQENDSKTQSDNFSDNVSSINYDQSSLCLWKDADVFHNLELSHEDPSTMGLEHEESCASASSHGYLDLHILKSVNSLDDFRFDEIVFS